MWLVCIFTVSMLDVSVDVFLVYVPSKKLPAAVNAHTMHFLFLLSNVGHPSWKIDFLSFGILLLSIGCIVLVPLIPVPPFINLRNKFETSCLHIFRVAEFCDLLILLFPSSFLFMHQILQQHSTSIICSEIALAWSQILSRLKLWAVILEEFGDGAWWKAIRYRRYLLQEEKKKNCIPHFFLWKRLGWH